MSAVKLKRTVAFLAAVILLATQASFVAFAEASASDDDPEQYVTEHASVSYDATVRNDYSPVDRSDLKKYNTALGIDVSEWQGTIDWKKVAASGVDFAYIRIGYRGYESGKINEDKNFRKNIIGAKSAGIDVGVYFYTQAVNANEAVAEAEFVLNSLSGYDINLPIVYDIESVNDDKPTGRLDTANLSRDKLTELCTSFCARVEKSGYKGMVYANKYWFTAKLNAAKIAEKYQIWIAKYIDKKSQTTEYNGEYNCWQYSYSAKVDGINGAVDVNRMYIIPPAQVTGLTDFNITDSSISLAWNSSKYANRYMIEMYNASGKRERLYATTYTSCKIPNLEKNKAYKFNIIARNDYNGSILDSAPSSCVTGTGNIKHFVTFDITEKTIKSGTKFTINANSSLSWDQLVWSSSDKRVATVSNGTVIGMSSGIAIITAALPGNKAIAKCTVTVQTSSISFKNSALSIGAGETVTLATSGTKPAGSIFTSSNSAVATVNANGAVIGKQAGSTTVTITCPGGATASCTVTVKPAPKSVKLNKSAVTVGVGEQYDLDSFVNSGAASYRRVFSSNNPSVAPVAASGGLVTAKKAGKATITLTCFNGVKTTCTVTVKPAPTSVKLNKSIIFVGVGEQYDLDSFVNSGAASYKRVFTSSDPSIASVAASGGLVTAKKVGNARITLTCFNGVKTVCDVYVKSGPSYVTLNKTSVSLKMGETVKLIGTLSSGSASMQRSFTSGNSAVASVSGDGTVTAKKPGKAVITVKCYNGVSAICTVTVKSSLAAPTSFKGVNQAGRKIVLTWKSVPSAGGYEIYRAKGSSKSYTKVKTTGLSRFENTGMTKGSTYSYRIRAYKKIGGKTYYSSYQTVSVKVTK